MEQLIRRFTLSSNEYLSRDCVGYYRDLYLRFREPGNPDFLNTCLLYTSIYSTPLFLSLGGTSPSFDKLNKLVVPELSDFYNKDVYKRQTCLCAIL